MPTLPDKSFDMILCDLPYGTTENSWDSVIPLDKLWFEYNRLIKDHGAIVLTAQTPFDKVLGASNLQLLRYEWIWIKNNSTGFLNAKRMPLKVHENVLVFYKKLPTYNPQKTSGHKPVNRFKKHTSDGSNYGKTNIGTEGGGQTDRYPVDVLYYPRDRERYHPTQKPVALFEYLIRTYTNDGDLILDNCIGSGTTAVAAARCNRNFVGIEKEQRYIDIANERLKVVQTQLVV
ncbi:DNA methylase [Paenibacillus sp. BIHB 4019]|uniref:Methyltransferase n=2 Tax=Paenibacillus sp. BIHB 4019 TaxID=1870819 RepID=A0A1B2DTR8_9BACL|nr:DNA methylase [Paenibacillus sp. BIHB 4019]